jgi:hypothetical protein
MFSNEISILTCLNLSPICDQVCRVYNMSHGIRNIDPKVEFDISQMSAFIKNYGVYVLWHILRIWICDFMQQTSSTDWQRLGVVVTDCTEPS